jgi:hypothetical protein
VADRAGGRGARPWLRRPLVGPAYPIGGREQAMSDDTRSASQRSIFIRSGAPLPSLESLYGWRSQYERMLRWHERLREDHSLDYLLTFFLNCYAMRDWLLKARTFRKEDLDKLINANLSMRLCRDLCNRSKHLVIGEGNNKPGVDANLSICVEWQGESRGTAYVVHAWDSETNRDVRTDLADLPAACVAFWNTTLAHLL